MPCNKDGHDPSAWIPAPPNHPRASAWIPLLPELLLDPCTSMSGISVCHYNILYMHIKAFMAQIFSTYLAVIPSRIEASRKQKLVFFFFNIHNPQALPHLSQSRCSVTICQVEKHIYLVYWTGKKDGGALCLSFSQGAWGGRHISGG